MTSILNVPATYYITHQDNMYIVWLSEKALLGFRTKTQAETYAKMHSQNNEHKED